MFLRHLGCTRLAALHAASFAKAYGGSLPFNVGAGCLCLAAGNNDHQLGELGGVARAL
jgi:hypothetical protein